MYRTDVCDVCLMFAANGEDVRTEPDEPAPLRLLGDGEDLHAGLPADEHACGDWATCNGACEEGGFSSSPCPTCGGLPGHRSPATIVPPDPREWYERPQPCRYCGGAHAVDDECDGDGPEPDDTSATGRPSRPED